MHLKSLHKDQLIPATHSAIKTETSATTNVVRHFLEIYDRDFHLECGHSSLFMMAVDEFGYDKQSAQRRVNAMTLSLAVPDVLDLIDSKKLCLQSAADIQSFLNKERGAKRRYTNEQTQDLVDACVGLSTRDVQLELARRNPTMDFRESKKFVAEDRIQVTHTLSTSIENKIERIKNLLAHANPYMTREEVLDYMAEHTLDAIDPVRKAERAEKRRLSLLRKQKDETRVEATINTEAEDSLSAQRIDFTEVVEPSTGEIQLVATFEDRSRAIAAADNHQVWREYDGEGCAFVDPKTGKRCGSRHLLPLLQRDHVIEFSRGGSNEARNLQLMCAQHNRFRWRNRSWVKEPEAKYA